MFFKNLCMYIVYCTTSTQEATCDKKAYFLSEKANTWIQINYNHLKDTNLDSSGDILFRTYTKKLGSTF